MSIGEFCKLDVICCDTSASISEVAQLMRTHHVGDVIVTGKNAETGVPVGIVTDRDIVLEVVAPKADFDMLTAGDIMNSPVQTIREQASFLEALRVMCELKVRRMPVVRRDGTLCGIVTTDDVAHVLATELARITSLFAEQSVVERQNRP